MLFAKRLRALANSPQSPGPRASRFCPTRNNGSGAAPCLGPSRDPDANDCASADASSVRDDAAHGQRVDAGGGAGRGHRCRRHRVRSDRRQHRYAAPGTAPRTRWRRSYPGIFTFGTDQPVYPPWYMGDDPANGEGFESRARLCRRCEAAATPARTCGGCGYPSTPRWRRARVVRRQPLSVLDHRPAQGCGGLLLALLRRHAGCRHDRSRRRRPVRSIGELKTLRLGVQVGTTSYTAATRWAATSRSRCTTRTATPRWR